MLEGVKEERRQDADVLSQQPGWHWIIDSVYQEWRHHSLNISWCNRWKHPEFGARTSDGKGQRQLCHGRLRHCRRNTCSDVWRVNGDRATLVESSPQAWRLRLHGRRQSVLTRTLTAGRSRHDAAECATSQRSEWWRSRLGPHGGMTSRERVYTCLALRHSSSKFEPHRRRSATTRYRLYWNLTINVWQWSRRALLWCLHPRAPHYADASKCA